MTEVSRNESRQAWLATAISALYYLWVGYVAYQQLPTFIGMQAGLGITWPGPLQFLAEHSWVCLAGAGALGAFLVAKEALMADKRRSIILTCLIAVVALIAVDMTKWLFVWPLLSLVEKLQ